MPLATQPIFKRSLLGALLACFLLPFMTLTCGGGKLATLSGVAMATGHEIVAKDPFTGKASRKALKSEPLAVVALLAAVAAFGLAFLAKRPGQIAAAVAAGLSGASLLAMKMKLDRDVLAQTQGMVGLQWEFGFWFAVLLALAAMFLLFLKGQETAAAAEAPGMGA